MHASCECVCVCIKATRWNMKYCSCCGIIYVLPISFFIGLTVTTVWIFLPYSVSRTGSCLHKEVNYDTNNNVGMPGRDVGGGEDERGWEGKTVVRRKITVKMFDWLIFICIPKNPHQMSVRHSSSEPSAPWATTNSLQTPVIDLQTGSESCCLTLLCFCVWLKIHKTLNVDVFYLLICQPESSELSFFLSFSKRLGS